MKQVSVTTSSRQIIPWNRDLSITPRLPRRQMSFKKLKHHLWSVSGCKWAMNEQCVIEDAKACKAELNTVQPMDLHMFQNSNLSVVRTRHSALISQFSTLTLDQMSSFGMTSRNITNGADKQRKYKVLWCVKCSSPMFSKTMCPTKRIQKMSIGVLLATSNVRR